MTVKQPRGHSPQQAAKILSGQATVTTPVPATPPPAAPAPAKPASKPAKALIPAAVPAKLAAFTPSPFPVHAAVSTVSMDTRKLDKKTQAKANTLWVGAQRGAQLDSYTAARRAAMAKQFGSDRVFVAGAMENTIIGIPCGGLAFEYLIAQDALPLGLVIHVNGQTGSNKSTLLFELFRWIVAAGGYGELAENESKISPDLLPSIFHWAPQLNRVSVGMCDCVEDWMNFMLAGIQFHQQMMIGTKENPGPGKTFPVLFGVDSIMGKLSRETQEKVKDAGEGLRAFPAEALKITSFMKTVPGMIAGWPFIIVLNNHLKLGKDEDGKEVRNTGGGKQVGFQESFEIECSVSNRKLESVTEDWTGRIIRLANVKNSFGNGFRQIQARVRWTEVPDPVATEQQGRLVQRQITTWDWDWALCHLLNGLQGREKAHVAEVFHFNAPQVSPIENLAWSRTLGMKAEDAVPWCEMGRRIQANPDIVHALRQALMIKQRPLLQGDYGLQRKQLLEAVT